MFTWGLFIWRVVHIDNAKQECYLAVMNDATGAGGNVQPVFISFNEQEANYNAVQSLYMTEGQRAALKYITADTTSGRLFSPTVTMLTSTFDYYKSSAANRKWMSGYWTSTETQYVDRTGMILSASSGERFGFRPHCCIDMSLYNT